VRRASVAALALGALWLLAEGALGAASGGGGTTRLVEAGGARFPDRAFVLTLPAKRRLAPGHVHVLENGAPVSSLSVVPVGKAGRDDFGVVLVIDASNSMRGRAIVDANAAARAFAAQRSPNQQLAVVTFNREASVLLPFTTDPEAISAALAKPPPLAQGTHLFDGVATALRILRGAKIASGSVIVLSDGADTGSRLTAAGAAAAARNDHVRIFSVGIQSRSFRAAPLRKLALDAGGDYSETHSTADLARIYAQLGARLSGEYLLRYRSHAGPNAKVRVVVRIDGLEGTSVSGYVTPPLPGIARAAPYHRPSSAVIWQSALTMLLVSLVSAGLFAGGVMAIVHPRRGNLRRRMAHFVTLRTSAGNEPEDNRLTGRVFAGAERSLETTKWWARFVETLELAEIRMQAVHLLLWTFVGTFFAMWLLAVLGGSLVFGLLGLGVPFAVRTWIKRKVDKKRALFGEQLPDNLQVLASALRAGHSLVGALSVVVEDAAEPSRTEFRRVIGDEQLGVPLEAALEVVVRRMDNRDLAQVGLVAALQRQTGGNMAEVLDRVTETIRERAELRRMVQTLTAQGRMSRWVVSLLPVVLLVAITVLNPAYVEPLFTETFGRVLLAASAVMLVTGSLVIKRIVNIKL
jgi:tight adherence protein B